MNLIIIPFHDWRKSQNEGFRTRDVHFIKALSENKSVENILVVNRPSTWLELLYKRSDKNVKGELKLVARYMLPIIILGIYLIKSKKNIYGLFKNITIQNILSLLIHVVWN